MNRPPPKSWNARRRTWRIEEDALLGTQPDAQIAKRLNWTPTAVASRRKKLGIPSFEKQRQSLLAKRNANLPDETVARLLRRSHRFVRRQKNLRRTKTPNWTAAEDRLLGKWPDERVRDEEVARQIRRTPKAVAHRRCALKLSQPNRQTPPVPKR